MILKGSQRAGAAQLAAHLLNDRDNDHVTVLELRGFVASDLHGAFHEAQAIAQGTRCQQYLFSLSLNPPKGAEVGEAEFERAADEAEKRLGQPRAVILHEKEGRRHAHVVWSRIDADEMRAVNMSHFKTKLNGLAKELYLEHGWELPEGLRRMGGKSPLNFTLAEWQQAKRLGLDPREIKDAFQSAYKQADSLKALGAALEDRGYFLAQGDRRGMGALDLDGNVYALARYAGIKTKELRQRYGDGDGLPSVAMVSADIKQKVTDKLKSYLTETRDAQKAERRPLEARRSELTAEHRAQRARLTERQAQRQQEETAARARRLRSGLMGLIDKVTGKATAIHQQNQVEAWDALRRDRVQRDRLVIDQMHERRRLQERLDKMRLRHVESRRTLNRELIERLRRPAQDIDPPMRKRGFSLDL
ncbi:relaxase [Sphingobium sp. AN641]|uniref:relaxase/mobilization nuclease domain-containing protein n=1 Tax=Sphingobium sp. AN641 TaxID=3133443 RepID=UPI0030BB74AA